MFRVQRKQCATCIFRPSHAEYLVNLLEQIRDPKMDGFFEGYRICHHSRDAVCAGFWARHKDNFQLGQLAQRLNFVELVDDDELPDRHSDIPDEDEPCIIPPGVPLRFPIEPEPSMPIVWAQPPSVGIGGYGDILRYVRHYRRLDTYDLILSSYENLDFSLDPERRERYLDNHNARSRKQYHKQKYRR